MAIDVIMPQMGESIAEGTVIRWMKKVGDDVERDEPLFEISTDKVDAEIPAPASGKLTEILAEEGKTVPVNAVVARIAAEGQAAAASPAAAEDQAPESSEPAVEQPTANAAMSLEKDQTATGTAAEAPQAEKEEDEEEKGEAEDEGGREVASLDERRRTRSSPLVRKIAKENDIDISAIEGSGVSGRVTKNDILQYIEERRAKKPAAAAGPQTPARPASGPAPAAEPPPQRVRAFAPGESIEIEPMSMMRRRIADHMIMSKRTSAHVATVFEVDMTSIETLRKKHKSDYEARGTRLTYLPFIVQAVIGALREFPILNASIDGDNVIYRKDINIGIAVALEWGLIVPVLKNADEKNILGVSRAINDLGDRARTKKLSPDEVQGGTFTITNPGIFGGLFGIPIINQPQVAILGVGGVKKRPIVVETKQGDAIVIRSMAYLSLSFDHRLIDGAVADQFMAAIRKTLEAGEFAL
ncbi:MAG TPA: 2-oxoglutarate dehydrogenase, E2 component, dihydrolipoamide succinyltransferase [Thermoanaerobaculia bacterium]|nr:2-oxoglutarate dehydrogenase, E2 component, dihydrolipoamide succinyltransferase [Thermoanaerobaculia bacterium]